MKNSPEGRPIGHPRKHRVNRRFRQDRRHKQARMENHSDSTRRGRRHQGSSRQGMRIQQQLQESHRHGNRDHIPQQRRRNRPSFLSADSRSYHPKRRPFKRKNRIERKMDGRIRKRPDHRMRRRSRLHPPVDFCVSDDRLVVNVELPGVSKDDVTVSVTENRLTIKGTKKPNRSDEKMKVRRSGRQYGRFRRVFPLPRNTEVSEIKADFKDGILTVSVPKPETSKSTEIQINAEE